MSGLDLTQLAPTVNAVSNVMTAIVALIASRNLKHVVGELRQARETLEENGNASKD